jgi:hypothetical protein
VGAQWTFDISGVKSSNYAIIEAVNYVFNNVLNICI